MYFNENNIMENLIHRVLGCKHENFIDIYGEDDLENLYRNIHKKYINSFLECIDNSLIYMNVQNNLNEDVINELKSKRESTDIILKCNCSADKNRMMETALGKIPFNMSSISNNSAENIYLLGPTFEYPISLNVPENFKVLAMLQVYNEIDIIEKQIQYLIDQKLDIYFIDNWSDDGTYELLEQYQKQYPNRIMIERFPVEGKSENFDLYNMLARKEELAKQLDYNWFIHYDADEMRVSPWKNVCLRDAIYYIDSLGYNIIENTVIDFKLVNAVSEDNIFQRDTFFDFGHRPTHFVQYKTWKKCDFVDIKSSAGHHIKVKNPKSFPLKILNRHYPYRSLKQVEKKVFKDRLPRMEQAKSERGWHRHYDNILTAQNVIANAELLLKWDKDTFDKLYIPLFTGCGVYMQKIEDTKKYVFPEYINKKIIIYGAGNVGKKAYEFYSKNNDIVLWVDKNYDEMEYIFNFEIKSPDTINAYKFDYIIVATTKQQLKDEIVYYLCKNSILLNNIICLS